MQTALRFIKLMTIAVWLGGIVFLSFVLAPFAFTHLPSDHIAGLVVGGTLNILDRMGLVCGVVFALATLSSHALTKGRAAYPRGQLALVGLMLAVTALIQFHAIPRMERDRQAATASMAGADGDINAAPADNPARMRFEHMHHISEDLEGVALFAGMGLVWCLARPAAEPAS